MFMPIASPLKHTSLRYTFLPATVGSASSSLPKLVVDSNAALREERAAGVLDHTANLRERSGR